MQREPLIRRTPHGLYCERGGFYIDPEKPVHRAIITHGHGDHARPGSRLYLAATDSAEILRVRLGAVSLQTLAYGEVVRQGDVLVSLHPAGHILGSAQVRMECDGEVWVVSGDYKLQADRTCAPFEPVRCHHFVTESTFGLPEYAFPDPTKIMAEIESAWRKESDRGRPTVVVAYALGKAQRVLAEMTAEVGPWVVHADVGRMNLAYRSTSVLLPKTVEYSNALSTELLSQALVLVPPHRWTTQMARKMGAHVAILLSGWVETRPLPPHVSQGLLLSDHADFDGLCDAVSRTCASHVYTHHGFASEFASWLSSKGRKASVL